MPLVIAEVFSKLPVGRFRIQVNNRKIPEGFYLGIGLDRRRDPAHRGQARQDRPGEGRPRCWSRRGDRPSRPAQCLALAEISPDGPVVRRPGARPRRGAPDPGRGPGGARRGHAGRDGARARAAGRRPADRPRPGLLHRHRLRDPARSGHESYGSICSGGRYDALASDGQHHLPGRRHLDRRLPPAGPAGRPGALSASRSTPTCVLVAVADEDGRPTGMRVAAALRARGIPGEVAPERGEVRQADPVSPSGGASRTSGSRVRGRPATRSRTSAAATRSTPTRRRGIRRRRTCVPRSCARGRRPARGDGQD